MLKELFTGVFYFFVDRIIDIETLSMHDVWIEDDEFWES